jgi:hypothetical protein
MRIGGTKPASGRCPQNPNRILVICHQQPQLTGARRSGAQGDAVPGLGVRTCLGVRSSPCLLLSFLFLFLHRRSGLSSSSPQPSSSATGGRKWRRPAPSRRRACSPKAEHAAVEGPHGGALLPVKRGSRGSVVFRAVAMPPASTVVRW